MFKYRGVSQNANACCSDCKYLRRRCGSAGERFRPDRYSHCDGTDRAHLQCLRCRGRSSRPAIAGSRRACQDRARRAGGQGNAEVTPFSSMRAAVRPAVAVPLLESIDLRRGRTMRQFLARLFDVPTDMQSRTSSPMASLDRSIAVAGRAHQPAVLFRDGSSDGGAILLHARQERSRSP